MTAHTKHLGYYLRSLAITAIVAFLLPLVILGLLLLGLAILRQGSPTAELGRQGYHQLLSFLTTLGGGDPWQGGLVMGATASLVGTLFDGYALYHSYSSSHR